MLEIRVLHSLGAFVGDSSDCRATAPTDQEDGAPRRRIRKAEGGDEAYGGAHARVGGTGVTKEPWPTTHNVVHGARSTCRERSETGSSP